MERELTHSVRPAEKCSFFDFKTKTFDIVRAETRLVDWIRAARQQIWLKKRIASLCAGSQKL